MLELFAGVGTMGLEAASRGASRVVMVERDRRVLRILGENVAAYDDQEVTEVISGDALASTTLTRAARGEARPFDLIFVDPPYAMMRDDATRERVLAQVARCAPLLAAQSFLVLRTPLPPDRVPHEVPGLVGPEVHKYAKDMFVLLYGPADADTAADRSAAADAATDGSSTS